MEYRTGVKDAQAYAGSTRSGQLFNDFNEICPYALEHTLAPTASGHRFTAIGPRGRTVESLARLHQRCVGCVNKPPKGVVHPLPGQPSDRALQTVAGRAFSPSGA